MPAANGVDGFVFTSFEMRNPILANSGYPRVGPQRLFGLDSKRRSVSSSPAASGARGASISRPPSWSASFARRSRCGPTRVTTHLDRQSLIQLLTEPSQGLGVRGYWRNHWFGIVCTDFQYKCLKNKRWGRALSPHPQPLSPPSSLFGAGARGDRNPFWPVTCEDTNAARGVAWKMSYFTRLKCNAVSNTFFSNFV